MGGGELRGAAFVLMSLFLLSIVPGTAIAQESVWTRMAPASSPAGRAAHDMAYDAESDRIVLFGGMGGFESGIGDDTWAYHFNSNRWTTRNPDSRPTSRGGHAMAYDTESDRVILFGGDIPGPETWAYDYNADTWTNVSPVVQPAAWYFVDMTYDIESDRIVLFGGCAGDSFFACPPDTRDETWVYDYNANTWTNMNPDASPSRRLLHRMAYDAESDGIVLFGGILGTMGADVLGDTWAYDFNANSWTEMKPDVAPPRQDTHDVAYDANADRVILYGGFDRSDTWAYDLDRNTWIRTDTGEPSRRGVARMAYDAESDRMVLFGGHTGTFPDHIVGIDETWAHQLVPTPPPRPPWWVYIAIGVAAASVVAVVAIYLTRRRRRMQTGEAGE